jgi:hypothetical protein
MAHQTSEQGQSHKKLLAFESPHASSEFVLCFSLENTEAFRINIFDMVKQINNQSTVSTNQFNLFGMLCI